MNYIRDETPYESSVVQQGDPPDIVIRFAWGGEATFALENAWDNSYVDTGEEKEETKASSVEGEDLCRSKYCQQEQTWK